MTRHEANRVAQWQQFSVDAVEELLMIAAGEIGTADRPLEEDIADKGDSPIRIMEDQMAWRMAGAVQHMQTLTANPHLIAFVQPAIRGEVSRWRKTRHLRPFMQALQQKGIALVWPFDGYAKLFGQVQGGTAVVEMAMGDEDAFDLEPMLSGLIEDAIEVTAGVNQRCGTAVRAIDHRGVLCVSGDGNAEISHGGWLRKQGAFVAGTARQSSTK